MFRQEAASSVTQGGGAGYELPVQSVQYSAKAILVFRVPEASWQEESLKRNKTDLYPKFNKTALPGNAVLVFIFRRSARFRLLDKTSE